MNFELLFTKEVIAPSRCVSHSSYKCGLGEDGQSVFILSRSSSRDPCWTTRQSIYDQSTEAQLRVNVYCIFLFQMGSYLECIRYCIYDSIATYLSLPALSFKTQPPFFV